MPSWAAPGDEWSGRRGFWTHRKRSATSLITIMAVLSGIAIGFKLFDRTITNNVVRDASAFSYTIEKRETEQLETAFTVASATNPIFKTSNGQYPGDSRKVEVRLTNDNEPKRDATFYVYVQNISVRDGAGNPVANTAPDGARFISFFTLQVRKQALGTHYNTGSYSTACTSGLRDLVRQSPCEMGLVKAKDSRNSFNQRTDQRMFEFIATETDDGSDQSAFKGWEIEFQLVFQARVPAVPEPSTV